MLSFLYGPALTFKHDYRINHSFDYERESHCKGRLFQTAKIASAKALKQEAEDDMGGINGPLQWESSEWRAEWWAMRLEKRAEGRIMQYGFYSKSSEEPLIVWSSGDCFKPEWAWGQRSGVVTVLSRVRIAPGPGSEDGNQRAGLRNVSQTEQAGLGSDCQERHGRTGVGDESRISAWVGQLTSGSCYYLDVESSAGLGRLDVWESAVWCWWPFFFFFWCEPLIFMTRITMTVWSLT